MQLAEKRKAAEMETPAAAAVGNSTNPITTIVSRGREEGERAEGRGVASGVSWKGKQAFAAIFIRPKLKFSYLA